MIVITDLDNTLGNSDKNIRKILNKFKPLSLNHVFCIVTGRSLKGLEKLHPAIPHNSYVAPWGGGNILFYDGKCFTPVQTIRELNKIENTNHFTYVTIPKQINYRETDEKFFNFSEVHKKTQCHIVSAFLRFSSNEEKIMLENAKKYQAQITTGKGHFWLHLSPFDKPRLTTINWFNKKYPNETTIYIGDAPADKECLDVATIFLTPQFSSLSKIKSTIVYKNFSDLPKILYHLVSKAYYENPNHLLARNME